MKGHIRERSPGHWAIVLDTAQYRHWQAHTWPHMILTV